MKTLHRLFSLAGVIALMIPLSGCLESTDTTCFQPACIRVPLTR